MEGSQDALLRAPRPGAVHSAGTDVPRDTARRGLCRRCAFWPRPEDKDKPLSATLCS